MTVREDQLIKRDVQRLISRGWLPTGWTFDIVFPEDISWHGYWDTQLHAEQDRAYLQQGWQKSQFLTPPSFGAVREITHEQWYRGPRSDDFTEKPKEKKTDEHS